MTSKNPSILKNSAYNVIGQLIPITVGFLTIPLLIKILGMDRFGLLSLLWAFLGYLTFFDLGLSRAIIKMGAELLAGKRGDEVPQTVWTTLWISGFLSLAGTILLISLSQYLVRHYFQIPNELESEGVQALNVIAISLPIVTLTSVLRGVLESQSSFFIVNILQIINGTMTYLSPLLVTITTKRIDHVILAISIVRLILLIVHWIVCTKQLATLSRIRLPTLKSSLDLLHFGSWLTVSNIISPIMVYFDRFFLGSIIPVGELAYYTTPYEIITRVLILPSAVSRTLFPAFSSTLNLNPESALDLLPKVLRMVAFIMAIVAAFFIGIAKPGLLIWLGPQFADKSALLLQVFSMGIFFNAIANIPYTFIQSAGRPDLTAKIHTVELPFYLLFLWFAAQKFGAIGAAFTWSLRLIVDCIFLLYFSQKITRRPLFKELNLAKLILPLLILWFLNNDWEKLFLGYKHITFIKSSFLLLKINIISIFLVILYYWAFYLRFDERAKILGFRKNLNSKRDPTDRFAALIVTFNPASDFKGNLESITKQFEKVCIVDNGSNNVEWIQNLAQNFSNIQMITNETNLGLGKALNQGMQYLSSQGFSWIATFDQDSQPSPSFLIDLQSIINKSKNPEMIGILAPAIFEKNLDKSLPGAQDSLSDFLVPVPTVITSGSLTNVSAYEMVGRFEESFFIDYIDHNFAFRLRKMGFLVAECPSVQLKHSLGESKKHQFLFMSFFSTHHSSLRRYYITRNRVHFYKEFFLIDPAWVLSDISFLIKEIIKITLVETDKIQKLKSIIIGFYDGIIGKSGSYEQVRNVANTGKSLNE